MLYVKHAWEQGQLPRSAGSKQAGLRLPPASSAATAAGSRRGKLLVSRALASLDQELALRKKELASERRTGSGRQPVSPSMLPRGLGGSGCRERSGGADWLRSIGAAVEELAEVPSLGAAEGWRRRSDSEQLVLSSLLRPQQQAAGPKAEGGQLDCCSSWVARSRLTALPCGVGEGGAGQ